MKETPTWLIISLHTKQPLYGIRQKTMVFSTQDIAYEVAMHFFKTKEEFIIINIPDIKLK